MKENKVLPKHARKKSLMMMLAQPFRISVMHLIGVWMQSAMVQGHSMANAINMLTIHPVIPHINTACDTAQTMSASENESEVFCNVRDTDVAASHLQRTDSGACHIALLTAMGAHC